MKRSICTGVFIVLFALSTEASEPRSGAGEKPVANPAEVTVMVRYRLLPDRTEQARHDIMQLVETVLAEEPDCLGIEVLQDLDDPTRITLVEKWTSRAAYEGPHMQTEHIQAFIATALENLAGPPDISFWTHPGDSPSGG